MRDDNKYKELPCTLKSMLTLSQTEIENQCIAIDKESLNSTEDLLYELPSFKDLCKGTI